jgi:hypothetical protein
VNAAHLDRVVNAVLYEGYLLYPYRPSVKNRHRWTFGGLYPAAYCRGRSGDACSAQTECLIAGPARATVSASVRFLHLQERSVGKLDPPASAWPADGALPFHPVPALSAGGRLYQPWQEAVERTVLVAECRLDELLHEPRCCEFLFPAGRALEPLRESEQVVGVLVREREAVGGAVTLRAAPAADGLFRLTVQVRNDTPWPADGPAERDKVLLRALVSAHVVVTVQDGDFVSLLDPPEAWRESAAACRNVGLWPVLVGEEGARDAVLASPIILYDYPQVADESPGDLFDATEIDEILTLRILTLTEDEKRAAAAVDDRARALLERTESLTPEALLNLHGAVRTLRPAGGAAHD